MSDDNRLTTRLAAYLRRNETATARVVITALALYWGIDKGLELNSVWQGVIYTVVPWLGGMGAIQFSRAVRGKENQR